VLVSAQLINTADKLHIWSEMYERPAADSLRVQDEIAQAVTEAIRQHLTGAAAKAPRQVHGRYEKPIRN
jgi:TolB-like protein